MDYNTLFQPGLVNEATFTVEEKHLAFHVGSGSARVLATPWMIGFMEYVAHRLLVQSLPEGFTSVGSMVHIRHLAPTPLGQTVRVRAEILEVEGNKVLLKVQAWDASELIGEGTHQRVIIDEQRFLRRVSAKAQANSQEKANG